MAVYKRAYHPYTGPLTERRRRFLVVSRYSLHEVFASRVFIVLLVLCFVPFLVTAVTLYVVNSPVAQTAFNLSGAKLFAIDNRFFMGYLQMMGWVGLFLAAWFVPGIISMDLANDALPLYLSRPFSRAEYLLGKATVVIGILSAITWIPAAVLYLMQAALSGNGWGWKNLPILGAIVAGSLLWIAFLALSALAISAWVRWRIIASAAMVAAMFVPAAFGVVANLILGTRWGLLLNFPYLNTLIWHRLFDVPFSFPHREIPVAAAWLMFLALAALSLYVLHQRIRAREVVRG